MRRNTRSYFLRSLLASTEKDDNFISKRIWIFINASLVTNVWGVTHLDSYQFFLFFSEIVPFCAANTPLGGHKIHFIRSLARIQSEQIVPIPGDG